jgi:hypothetical protein
MPVLQDQKTTIVGQQLEAVILMAEVPTDPAIPGRALPSGGRKAEQSYPVILPGAYIPEGFANLGKRPQIVLAAA